MLLSFRKLGLRGVVGGPLLSLGPLVKEPEANKPKKGYVPDIYY